MFRLFISLQKRYRHFKRSTRQIDKNSTAVGCQEEVPCKEKARAGHRRLVTNTALSKNLKNNVLHQLGLFGIIGIKMKAAAFFAEGSCLGDKVTHRDHVA